MLRKIMLTLFVLVLPALSYSQVSEAGKPVKVVTDANIVGTTVWSADTVWNLTGFVYVESGEILIIEPGTIIKGNPGQGASATALIVARGGKIYAEGTEKKPIIFTAISDNVDDPNDIPLGAAGKGLWGSVIILGSAPVTTATGVAQIEGIPTTEPRAEYGGVNPNDNSGVFRYVSLRHGGSIIGAANEINGLTMGGVGRGTKIDHVEAFQNLDDGFEFFGGTVNTSYLAAVFCDDDGFDWDFGFSGSGQFWFVLKDAVLPSSGSRAHEIDYCTPGGCIAAPGVWPYVSNVTGIGSGAASGETDNDYVVSFRSGTGGYFYNNVYEDFAQRAVDISNAASNALIGTQVKLENNLYFGFGAGATFTAICNGAGVDAYMAANNAITATANVASISRIQNNGLDPRSINTAVAGAVAVADPNGYIVPTTYRGAFEPNVSPWLCGWSATSFYNILIQCTQLADCNCITDNGKPVQVFTDANMVGTVVWNQDTVINLSGFVYVETGEQLIIGPGTVIKGNPGQGAAATALIVARGGKIYATGASDCPVVFTASTDDVDDPNDIPLGAAGKGLWGSVIILGNSTVTTATGVAQIEGIPTTEPRGEFGGGIPNDNSGVFRYASLRHGGSIIGAANEINGLTMGGVGSGTVIDHVEAYQNLDDGFEFFGGTVNTSYLITAFCDDDGFDWDFGYSGSGQFWFCIKDAVLPSSGSRAHEIDYCTPGGCITAPGAWPYISNVTGYGSGAASGETDNDYVVSFRSGTGGYFYNSIYSDWARKAVDISNAASNALIGTQVKLENNFFANFGAGTTWTAISNGTGVDAYMAANNSLELTDPLARGTSRIQNAGLDPRPATCSPAATSFQAVVDPNGYIQTVGYSGAFDPAQPLSQSWAAGWTFLYCGGHMGEVATYTCSCCTGNTGNVDGDPGDLVDISDLSAMVDFLFFGGSISSCFQENDVDNSASVDISDLQALIDFLFFGASLPACP
ncbi:MAG: T9SS C-terminal target domain-containing protein [Candidatus Zixiibacteriota bacterium]